MSDSSNPQKPSKEIASTNVEPSLDSGSTVTSTPSDCVQKPARKSTLVPQTAEEWDEYEAAHIKRTGPPGHHFKQFIDRLEREALKEQEGRQYSGDTSDEETEEDAHEDSTDEDDEEEHSGCSGSEEDEDKEEELTTKEILAIRDTAAHPGNSLGPLPGTIGAEVCGSDTDGSDYNAEDDEASTASNSSSDEADDEDIMDID